MNILSARRFLPMAVGLLFATDSAVSAEEGTAIPYNSVNKSMTVLKSRKIKGADCVPWYIKDTRKDVILDPQKARFRVRTWDDEEIPLDIEPLSDVPVAELSDYEKKLIKEEGFTHRMWIPKADKRFLDGDIVHSLPKGSVSMAQGIGISREILGK